MNLRSAFLFQFGNREAIEEAARSSGALWTGGVLTLTAAIARNYDQTWIGETPLWLFGNLLFSLVSSCLSFCVIYLGFVRRRIPKAFEPRSFWNQYRGFLGLFWMTAPIAWLYAIPVERWFESYRSAQPNLALLGIVSAWRVVLLARVLSVTASASMGRALVWTLFAASLETVIVVIVGAFSKIGESVVRGMSGMRNSPEEELVLRALSEISAWAAIVFLITAIGLFVRGGDGLFRFLPETKSTQTSWGVLLPALLFFAGIAVQPQTQLRNNFEHDCLVRAGRYEESNRFLAVRDADDFSHYKRLAPDPYAEEVWEHLAGCLDRISADAPHWIRERYFFQVEGALAHDVSYGWNDHRLPTYISILEFLSRIPEGEALKTRLHVRLEHLATMEVGDRSDPLPHGKMTPKESEGDRVADS